MAGYTKLFSTIVTSSIWREDNTTRIVWITMLALSDATGHVDASIPGLAAAANVEVDECERSIAKLLAPDKYSRTPEFEGRRIEPEPGGWRILNHAKYREKGRSRDRSEYYRQYRARRSHNSAQPRATSSNPANPIAEAEANNDNVNKNPTEFEQALAQRRSRRTQRAGQQQCGGDGSGEHGH